MSNTSINTHDEELTTQGEAHNDPFYNEENLQRLRMSIAQMESGQVVSKTLDELIAMEKE